MRKKDICIEDLIPFEKRNAISREELCRITGLNDRDVRRLISEAKSERGAYIINIGNGYFFPTVEEALELQSYIKQEEAKAKSIFESIKDHKAFLEDIQKGRIADGFN